MSVYSHADREWLVSTDGINVTIAERDAFSTDILARLTMPARTFTLIAAETLLDLDTREKREARA